jgi:predicted Na+-dependent transporter
LRQGYLLRGRDLLLIAVALVGIAGGVALPGMAGVFSPYVLYFMMAILFLSFLRINFTALFSISAGTLLEVAVWSAWKLLALPVILWGLCRVAMPELSLSVLLLAGVSAGVTAPFFAGILGASVERVLQVVVVTSLLVPLTLPALAHTLMEAKLAISYWPMVRMLLLVMFVPLFVALALRRLWPAMMSRLDRVQFPVILALFLVINLGVFANDAEFLRAHLKQVVVILLICCVLTLVFAGSGFLLGRISGGRLSSLDGAVLMTYINNVLIVVFSARFFGAIETLTAAVYMLPLFMMLLPIRIAAQRLKR